MKASTLYALSALSGIALPLSLPNEIALLGMPALGLIALAPLFYGLSREQSAGARARAGAIFGLFSNALGSFWLAFFKSFSAWTIGASTLGYMGEYALLFPILAWLAGRIAKGYRPIIIALGYVAFEYFKSTGFLGYPWGILAHSWGDVLSFIQVADSLGVYGPSMALAFSNALIAELAIAIKESRLPSAEGTLLHALKSRSKLALFTLSVFGTFLGYGAIVLSFTPEIEGSLAVAVIQQNGDSWESDDLPLIKKSIGLSEKAIADYGGRVDMIAWSESSLRYPYPFFDVGPGGSIRPRTRYDAPNYEYYSRYPKDSPLIPFIRDTGIPLLTGSPYIFSEDPLIFGNTAVLIRPDGMPLGPYAKRHPVPFAEAIPFMEYQWMRDLMQGLVGLPGGGYISGRGVILFEVGAVDGGPWSFGVPICFEDAFPDVVRDFVVEGADLIVNITNDSWSMLKSAEWQHLAAARWRSVEFRVATLRATNGGVSCVIGSRGEILDILPLFEATSKVMHVPVYKERGETIMSVACDVFGSLIALAFLVCFIIEAVKHYVSCRSLSKTRVSAPAR